MRAMLTPSANDRPRFHLDMPVSELTKCDTRAIKASVVSLAPSVTKTEDGVTHEIWPTPTDPHGAWGLKLPDPNSGIHLTGVQRPTHEGLEAASRQTEPGEKNLDEPQQPCLTPLRSGQGHLDLSRSILTSSQAHRISIEERPAGHPSQSNGSGIYQEVG